MPREELIKELKELMANSNSLYISNELLDGRVFSDDDLLKFIEELKRR